MKLYKVFFDFGAYEFTVYHRSNEKARLKIAEGALLQARNRGFEIPFEPRTYTIEPYDWDYEYVLEYCPRCSEAYKRQPLFEVFMCPHCHHEILPCAYCMSQHCAECPFS